MIEILRSSSVLKLPSELDPFLFALIDGEQSGTSVSVLSALARSDLDPWEEAAKLSRLTQEAAADSLASTIASLRRRPIAFDPKSVAARLVTRLPTREALPPQQDRDLRTTVVGGNRNAVIFAIFINGLLMAFAFGHPGTTTNSPPIVAGKETHAVLSQGPPSSKMTTFGGKALDGLQKPRL